MTHISVELLKIAGVLQGAGHRDASERLTELAEAVSVNDRLLTVAEAAEWLNCGRRTLDQMVSDRRVPAHLIGGRYRFDKLEILSETKL